MGNLSFKANFCFYPFLHTFDHILCIMYMEVNVYLGKKYINCECLIFFNYNIIETWLDHENYIVTTYHSSDISWIFPDPSLFFPSYQGPVQCETINLRGGLGSINQKQCIAPDPRANIPFLIRPRACVIRKLIDVLEWQRQVSYYMKPVIRIHTPEGVKPVRYVWDMHCLH